MSGSRLPTRRRTSAHRISSSSTVVVRTFPGRLHHVVDIGCGPGDVDVRLARAVPGVHITAVDGSAPMIALARDAIRAAGLETRVTVLQERIPGVSLPDHGSTRSSRRTSSITCPIRRCSGARSRGSARAGAAVAVMDLIRPATPGDARRIVDAVAAGEDPILREDFYNSLCAAFTIDELREQLAGGRSHLRGDEGE